MIKSHKIFDFKNAFGFSISLGFIIWFMFYFILPINTSALSFETISFIGCCIISFFTGYYVFNFSKTQKNIKKSINWFIVLTAISLAGLTIRYVDLFFIRDVKWGNSYFNNKLLKSVSASKPSLFITLVGTLRVIYIVPILILIVQKNKNKIFWIVALFLIVYGSVEIFLFGTRKPFFILMLLIIIASFYFNRKLLTLNRSNILIIILAIIFLGFFSYLILDKRLRETQKEKNSFVTVVNSRYNDFVKIKDFKLKQFEEYPNTVSTKSQIMFLHTGQYVVHGFFELDYIVNNNLPRAYGLYSFNPLFKFTNRLGITKKNLNTVNYHTRDYVYTSFFGSLFIDFGWFTLVFMFLLGVFQRWVFSMAQTHLIAKVFFVILLSINITMPIFNLMSGSGLYLFIFMLAIMCYSIKR